MKFEKISPADGVTIPAAALKLSGFTPGEDAEYHTLKDAVVVLKKQMTASEVVRAAWALQQLSAELCVHLAEQCCPCDGCADCGGLVRCCPYSPLNFAVDIELPDELRELAGIEKDAPLHVELLDDGEISICANHEGPGLWDVPAPMMQGLLAAGLCPAGLEDALEQEDVIYGG